jgi:hypothetical protein
MLWPGAEAEALRETGRVVALVRTAFAKVVPACGARLHFILGAFIAAGSEARGTREGKWRGRIIRDGCPTDIGVIMSP